MATWLFVNSVGTICTALTNTLVSKPTLLINILKLVVLYETEKHLSDIRNHIFLLGSVSCSALTQILISLVV